MRRRQLIQSSLAVAAGVSVAAHPLVAIAQSDWAPSKPVRIIVPIIGSTNDVLARMIAPRLQEVFGQPFIVENKPGAGGNIGADIVAKSAPDGHTLLVGYNGPIAVNVSLFEKMPYDPLKDLAPISLMVKAAQYFAVNPKSGITSVKDFVLKAKANPGKMSYASIAVGSASHLAMEMLKSTAGIHVVHIPYRGTAPAITDLVGGVVEAGFFVPGNVQQFAKEGRLKLLATTGRQRFASTPDVPTMMESGFKEFEATAWIGLLAQGNTPRPIIDRYHRELVKILNSPDIRKRLADMEFEHVASTPEQFGAWIRQEIPRWGKVIKYTGAKVD
jgi:tripartite-type tricarboxylate transporter receptor subunit TctC